MKQEEFKIFGKRHCDMLQLGASELDGPMLKHWERILTAAPHDAYPLDACMEASDYIATRAAMPTKYGSIHRTQHLAIITSYCRRKREDAARRSGPAKDCPECRAGLVEVPHPRDVVNGEWRGTYTMVVSCSSCCEGATTKRLTLMEYERDVLPNWRELLARRSAKDAAVQRMVPSKVIAGDVVAALAKRMTPDPLPSSDDPDVPF